eukprot:RCo004972
MGEGGTGSRRSPTQLKLSEYTGDPQSLTEEPPLSLSTQQNRGGVGKSLLFSVRNRKDPLARTHTDANTQATGRCRGSTKKGLRRGARALPLHSLGVGAGVPRGAKAIQDVGVGHGKVGCYGTHRGRVDPIGQGGLKSGRKSHRFTDVVAHMGLEELRDALGMEVGLAEANHIGLRHGVDLGVRVAVHVGVIGHPLDVDNQRRALRQVVREVRECLWGVAARAGVDPPEVVGVLDEAPRDVRLDGKDHLVAHWRDSLVALNHGGLQVRNLLRGVQAVVLLCKIRRQGLHLHVEKVRLDGLPGVLGDLRHVVLLRAWGLGEVLHVEHRPQGALLEGVLINPHPNLGLHPSLGSKVECVLRHHLPVRRGDVGAIRERGRKEGHQPGRCRRGLHWGHPKAGHGRRGGVRGRGHVHPRPWRRLHAVLIEVGRRIHVPGIERDAANSRPRGRGGLGGRDGLGQGLGCKLSPNRGSSGQRPGKLHRHSRQGGRGRGHHWGSHGQRHLWDRKSKGRGARAARHPRRCGDHCHRTPRGGRGEPRPCVRGCGHGKLRCGNWGHGHGLRSRGGCRGGGRRHGGWRGDP